MTATERSINIFVDSPGSFDRIVTTYAQRALESALGKLEKADKTRRPQVHELAVELGVHPRRVVRLLEAFGMRGRVRERRVYGRK